MRTERKTKNKICFCGSGVKIGGNLGSSFCHGHWLFASHSRIALVLSTYCNNCPGSVAHLLQKFPRFCCPKYHNDCLCVLSTYCSDCLIGIVTISQLQPTSINDCFFVAHVFQHSAICRLCFLTIGMSGLMLHIVHSVPMNFAHS